MTGPICAGFHYTDDDGAKWSAIVVPVSASEPDEFRVELAINDGDPVEMRPHEATQVLEMLSRAVASMEDQNDQLKNKPR